MWLGVGEGGLLAVLDRAIVRNLEIASPVAFSQVLVFGLVG
jgi:hypothetical protein